jgi:hypothetical protein
MGVGGKSVGAGGWGGKLYYISTTADASGLLVLAKHAAGRRSAY